MLNEFELFNPPRALPFTDTILLSINRGNGSQEQKTPLTGYNQTIEKKLVRRLFAYAFLSRFEAISLEIESPDSCLLLFESS
jgi:hypothetical protein